MLTIEDDKWSRNDAHTRWYHPAKMKLADPEIRQDGYDFYIYLTATSSHPHVGPFPTLAAAKAAFRLLYLEQEP